MSSHVGKEVTTMESGIIHKIFPPLLGFILRLWARGINRLTAVMMVYILDRHNDVGIRLLALISGVLKRDPN